MSETSYLKLTRRINESIEITIPDSNGSNKVINIGVTRFKGNQVQLGIEANKQIKIVRTELKG